MREVTVDQSSSPKKSSLLFPSLIMIIIIIIISIRKTVFLMQKVWNSNKNTPYIHLIAASMPFCRSFFPFLSNISPSKRLISYQSEQNKEENW